MRLIAAAQNLATNIMHRSDAFCSVMTPLAILARSIFLPLSTSSNLIVHLRCPIMFLKIRSDVNDSNLDVK